jgi:hypothetical protein
VRFGLLAVICALAAPVALPAQRGDTAKSRPIKLDDACCSVVALDSATAIVTARETASGYTFRFKVSDRKLLAALKIGDRVWADFNKKTIRLRRADATPCCGILPPAVREQRSATITRDRRRSWL